MWKPIEYIADKIGFEPKVKEDPKANFPTVGLHEQHHNILFSVSYDGEKNPGQMGAIKRYFPNYRALRNRGWQLFLDSDVAQGVIKKHCRWTIGKGLRLQAQPVIDVLASNAATITRDEWTKGVEQRWKLFANSRKASYDWQQTLHGMAFECEKNTLIGGDMLVIMRVEDGNINIQIVDGDHVVTPFLSQKETIEAAERGNFIKHGIEIDNRGRHVAYYVRTRSTTTSTGTEFRRVEARNSDGMLMAWMVYGMRFRKDSLRGIPLMAAVMETAAKLDRYKEAAVSGAEQRAKINYFIEHTADSTGENPMTDQVKNSLPLNHATEGGAGNLANEGIQTAAKVTSMTDSVAVNMPIGATMKAILSDMEMNFKDFYITILNMLTSSVDIPLEVLLSKYDSNFSASRAALKEWEHTLVFNRAYFSEQFYKPIYQMWLFLEDLKNTVRSPGLLKAVETKDDTTIEAYSTARWIGANVPHIDPVKEAKAEREKLGPEGKHVPLTTPSAAAEALGEGDYADIVEVFTEEIEKAPKTEPILPEPNTGGDGDAETD